MQKKFTRRAVTTGALATFGLAASRVSAQAWPSRPVRFVVPFPAGNAGDITARLISTRLSEKLGASIVVENRAGASGLIGTQSVKTAEPDGYTFLVTSLSPMVVMPATRADLPYEPQKDFQGVSLIGRTAMALVASKSLTGETVKDVIADVKASPGKYLYGHIGTGSLSHLSMALMIRAAGLEMTAVPYKGSGEVMTELIAGRVHLMWDGMTSSLPQVQAGTVRGLAVSSGARSGLAPNLPTMRESNIPVAHDIDAWTGLLAPAGTPAEIVQKLNSEIAIIMKDPAFIERARTLFLDPYEPSSPAYFQDFLKTELEKWVEVHKAAGIKTVR